MCVPTRDPDLIVTPKILVRLITLTDRLRYEGLSVVSVLFIILVVELDCAFLRVAHTVTLFFCIGAECLYVFTIEAFWGMVLCRRTRV